MVALASFLTIVAALILMGVPIFYLVRPLVRKWDLEEKEKEEIDQFRKAAEDELKKSGMDYIPEESQSEKNAED